MNSARYWASAKGNVVRSRVQARQPRKRGTPARQRLRRAGAFTWLLLGSSVLRIMGFNVALELILFAFFATWGLIANGRTG